MGVLELGRFSRKKGGRRWGFIDTALRKIYIRYPTVLPTTHGDASEFQGSSSVQ